MDTLHILTTRDDVQSFIRDCTKEAVIQIKDEITAQPELEKEWLSGREVMTLLDISRPTLLRWRNDGKLTCSRIGGITLYRRDDIRAFLLSHRLAVVR